jgi:hypothetical protein
MRNLIAFHNDSAIKDRYLLRVKAHQAADEIVQSYGYWKNGRGCAVGCTLHSDEHAAYETELGIPRIIAYLQDRIFEGLEVNEARKFPAEFLEAIRPGADLSNVWYNFAHWLLIDPADGVIKYAVKDSERDAIKGVAALFERSLRQQEVAQSEWQKAKNAADAAAYDAAAYAADAAAAYAADAAAYAAYAAAYDAAAYAADAAAYAAARGAARQQYFLKMKVKLIELLKVA